MKTLVTAVVLLAIAGIANANNHIQHGSWGVLDMDNYIRAYTRSISSSGTTVAMNFSAGACDTPSIQMISLFDRVSDSTEYPGHMIEERLQFRVDKKPVQYWDELLAGAEFEEGGKVSYSFIGRLSETQISQILNGNTLRLKLVDSPAERFSLDGSSRAIQNAYTRCANLPEDDEFFPVLEPGESDDDYFSL